MFTYLQYLNRECTHHQYYQQFLNEAVIKMVDDFVGHDRIMQSTDPFFNDIPLQVWERLGNIYSYSYGINAARKMRELGDYMTSASEICILKEAARQIKEKNQTI